MNAEMDCLSQVCPQCGGVAEYPDCEQCGYDFAGQSDNTPGPGARTFNPTGDLPEELTGADRWIVWQYRQKHAEEKPTKVPVTPEGGALFGWQKNPAQWMSFDVAVSAYNANPALSGIGFVLAQELGIVGVDMDHAIDTASGEVAGWAQQHISDFDTYTEVSPSGTGYRMFTLGTLPDGCRKKVGHREIYNGGRWLTVTGNVVNDSPIMKRPEAVARYIAAMTPQATTSNATTSTGARSTQALVQEFMTADNLHDASTAIAFRLVDDGMKPGKVIEFLRGCMQAMPDKGDMGRWSARYNDIPRAVDGAVQKLPMAEKPILEVVNLQGFMRRELSPAQFAVESIIPRRVVTLLGADGGMGKSSLALAVAATFAAGQPWAGLPTSGGRAVFVSLEDEASIVEYRLQHVVKAYALDAASVEQNLAVIDGTEGDGSLAFELAEFGMKRLLFTSNTSRLEELATGAGLIVVDNASDAFDADENSRRMVRGFIRKLTQIARKEDAGVLLLAHVNKDAAKYGGKGANYSGSTAWNNSVRSRLALVMKDAGIELVHEKANHGPKAAPVALCFTEDGVLMPGHADAPVSSLMDAQDDAAVLAALQAAHAADVNVPTGRTGPSTTQHVLSTFPELPKSLQGATGRGRFWAALERLRRKKCVGSEMYTASDRHKKPRFVVKDAA